MPSLPRLVHIVDDGVEDAVQGCFVDIHLPHGAGLAPDLAEAAFQDVSGANGVPQLVGEVVADQGVVDHFLQPTDGPFLLGLPASNEAVNALQCLGPRARGPQGLQVAPQRGTVAHAGLHGHVARDVRDAALAGALREASAG